MRRHLARYLARVPTSDPPLVREMITWGFMGLIVSTNLSIFIVTISILLSLVTLYITLTSSHEPLSSTDGGGQMLPGDSSCGAVFTINTSLDSPSPPEAKMPAALT